MLVKSWVQASSPYLLHEQPTAFPFLTLSDAPLCSHAHTEVKEKQQYSILLSFLLNGRGFFSEKSHLQESASSHQPIGTPKFAASIRKKEIIMHIYFCNRKPTDYVNSLSIPLFVSFTHALFDDPNQHSRVPFWRYNLFQTINNNTK